MYDKVHVECFRMIHQNMNISEHQNWKKAKSETGTQISLAFFGGERGVIYLIYCKHFIIYYISMLYFGVGMFLTLIYCKKSIFAYFSYFGPPWGGHD